MTHGRKVEKKERNGAWKENRRKKKGRLEERKNETKEGRTKGGRLKEEWKDRGRSGGSNKGK